MSDPTLLTVNGHTPEVDDEAFLANGVVVAGRVRIGARSSVWFNSAIRSEVAEVVIGEETNLQDLTTVHADPGFGVTIGDRVTIGHRCVIHGCTIEDDALIGMGAVVLNGAVIGEGAVVGAGAVVTEGTVIPPRTVAVGVPAKVRDLPLPEIPRPNVAGYVLLASLYGEPGGGPTAPSDQSGVGFGRRD